MNWSNLLSGIVGAALGGLLAIIAAVLTMRQQRSLTRAMAAEDRQQAKLRLSYTASTEILTRMLALKDLMWQTQVALASGGKLVWDAFHSALDHILIVDSAMIADQALRSRVMELTDLCGEWYENTDRSTNKSVNQERLELVMPYMQYINQSIRAHLDDQPLPPYQPRPDLLAVSLPKNESQTSDHD
jgi:hypothetical protein